MKIWSRILKGVMKHADGLYPVAMKISLMLFASYILASTAAVSLIKLVGKDTIIESSSPVLALSNPVRVRKSVNFVTVRKQVEGRNIFNSKGEFPEEADPGSEARENKDSTFDESAPCAKTSLNIELMGTIFMGESSKQSLATVREKGYNIADIYRVGDSIFGQDQAKVHAIQLRRMVINNGGKKECLELKEPKDLFGGSPANSKTKDKANKIATIQPPTITEGEGSSTRITLENSYVTDALAAGFAKVLKEGRLVPHTKDGKMIGFKLIGITKDSLYSRVGLASGDVLTSVNGTSMAQPEQGFVFLSTLAEEKEVRLEFLKKGKDPSTITIEIK